MAEVTRYTTPTITYTFSTVNVSNIAVAYLTAKQSGETIFEKTLADATIDSENNTMAWSLTQAETGSLTAGLNVIFFCDWKLTDGLRGKADTSTCRVSDSGKDEVI